MRVTYIGSDDQSENHVCEVFGRSFPRGEAVDISDAPAPVRAKLAANPRFEVEGDPSTEDEGGLADLTVVRLKALAADRGVDLGDATKKADIIAALELAAEAEA